MVDTGFARGPEGEVEGAGAERGDNAGKVLKLRWNLLWLGRREAGEGVGPGVGNPGDVDELGDRVRELRLLEGEFHEDEAESGGLGRCPFYGGEGSETVGTEHKAGSEVALLPPEAQSDERCERFPRGVEGGVAAGGGEAREVWLCEGIGKVLDRELVTDEDSTNAPG